METYFQDHFVIHLSFKIVVFCFCLSIKRCFKESIKKREVSVTINVHSTDLFCTENPCLDVQTTHMEIDVTENPGKGCIVC